MKFFTRVDQIIYANFRMPTLTWKTLFSLLLSFKGAESALPTGRMLNVNHMPVTASVRLCAWEREGSKVHFERYLNQLCRNFQTVCQPEGRGSRWASSEAWKANINISAWQQKAGKRKSHALTFTHTYTKRHSRIDTVITALCAYKTESPSKADKTNNPNEIKWNEPKPSEARQGESNETTKFELSHKTCVANKNVSNYNLSTSYHRTKGATTTKQKHLRLT